MHSTNYQDELINDWQNQKKKTIATKAKASIVLYQATALSNTKLLPYTVPKVQIMSPKCDESLQWTKLVKHTSF